VTVPVADRRERRRQDDAADRRVARGSQHAQRAVARGDDELVLVLGLTERERRRDVQHGVAAGHGLSPAFVGGEVGGHHLQGAVADHVAHLALP